MTSPEQAKAAAEEMDCTDNPYTIAIIQKHMDAFARKAIEAKDVAVIEAANLLLKLGRQDMELAQLKEQNRELLKDKERLDALLASSKFSIDVHLGYNNFCHEHQWKELVSREDIDQALDKAALAKGDV